MKILSNALLAVIMTAFVFTSCKNDPTANNADIAKMSEAGKKAMDEESKRICSCLKEKSNDFKTLLDEVKPKLAEAEKSENPMESVMQIYLSVEKTEKSFGECMSKISPEDDEASSKALKEDFEKIMSEVTDNEAKVKKPIDIMNAYLTKNCANEQKIFADYIGLGEKMNSLQKKIMESRGKPAEETEEPTEEKKEEGK